MHPLGDFLAENKYSYNDIDANRIEIGDGMRKALDHEFDKFGFTITDFRIEGTSFDQDTMDRINRVADISAESAAAKAAGLNYREFQHVEALRDAAKNEGGAAGAGVGIGAGIGLGQNMMQQMGGMGNTENTSSGTSATESELVEKLTKLRRLHDAELISDEEYRTKKQALLEEI